MDYALRQEKVRASLEKQGLDALILTSPANVQYVTGFAGEGAAVIDSAARVFTDGRYSQEAAAAAAEAVVSERGMMAGLIEGLQGGDSRRVGFESARTYVSAAERLRAQVPEAEFVGTENIVEPLRARKSPEEVDLIRRAADVTDKCLEAVLAADKEQLTERQVAMDIHRCMIDLGAEDVAFELIVAVGPGAAEPHHRNGLTRVAGPGMLLMDIGAKVDGYCSDLTRTVFLGRPDDDFRRLYSATYEAQRLALAAVRPGANTREIDAVARDYLSGIGLGELFCHGLGHGVGLEIHEAPNLGPTRDDTLEVGQVITIEPGLYQPGWGGVRIEDLVLVGEDGAVVLSAAPKIDPADL